ncbi:hypothetical protein CSUB01_01055 [Colletotrichum sublineola]|uniref:Uncharacterized protein n=1 Tax=Colletotrichum sublineola TaxID=1173701 RepID=A0A066X8K8_COLSU|nr:hypothetical protein CSUB01_01055 [Colletotrichum sublineola]
MAAVLSSASADRGSSGKLFDLRWALGMDESRTSVPLEFTLSSRLNGTGDGHAANALERAYATVLFLFSRGRGRDRNNTPAWDIHDMKQTGSRSTAHFDDLRAPNKVLNCQCGS